MEGVLADVNRASEGTHAIGNVQQDILVHDAWNDVAHAVCTDTSSVTTLMENVRVDVKTVGEIQIVIKNVLPGIMVISACENVVYTV